MLITEFVFLQHWSSYANKLEALGYQLPKHVGVNGKLVYSVRESIRVEIAHLPPSSTAKVKYKCSNCQNVFEVTFGDYNNNLSKLCFICARRSKKGKPQTAEWIEKRVQKLRGKTRTSEQREAMAIATRNLGWVGEKHPNFKVDKSRDERELRRLYPEYREWRTSIYERDKYTCQICGAIGGSLHAHHLHNYSNNESLRVEPNNGVTLCKECHRAFHKIYGRKDNTPEQFVEFISTKRNS